MSLQANRDRMPASPVKKEGFYYGWIVLAALLVMTTISFGVCYSFGVFFKSLELEFGWSRAMTSGIFSAYMALYAVLALAGGWALDRFGARKVGTLMAVFTSLGLLLSSRVTQPWHLFLSYSLLLAIGTGPAFPFIAATASRWFARRRGLAIGIASVGASLGILVMTPVSAYFLSRYSWQTSYLLLGIIAFVAMFPCAQLLRKPPTQASVVEKLAPDPGRRELQFEASLPLSQALKTRNLWLLVFMNLTFGICVFTVTTHIIPHAIDLGISPIQAASVLTLIGGTGVLGKLVMGRVSDIMGRKKAAVICSLLVAGAMLWLTFSSNLAMLYVFAIAMGFSQGGLTPPLSALSGDIFGLRHIGMILGMTELGWGVGSAIGPPLAGYIFDSTGQYFWAFLTGMTVMLIFALLAFSIRMPGKPARP